MAAPLRVGIVGANAHRGWAKDAHLAAINALPGLEIHAVSARDRKLADEAAAFFGARRAYADSLELTQDPGIDVVAVTVKVPEHHAIVLAALAAGKHVYCEWPLGRDVAESEELAEAARQAGLHVVIGTQGACSPAVRHAAELVRKGVIGEPLQLDVMSPTGGWGPEAPSFYSYLNDHANGATVAAIPGGHTLATIEAIVGRYANIHALGATRIGTVRVSGSEETVARTCLDHIVAIGRHESGCLSSLEVVGGAPPQLQFQFQLRGSEGTLEITGHHPGGYQCAELSVTTLPVSEPQPAPAAPGLGGQSANVAEVWSSFAGDIRKDIRTVPDFSDAVRLARLVAALDPGPARKS